MDPKTKTWIGAGLTITGAGLVWFGLSRFKSEETEARVDGEAAKELKKEAQKGNFPSLSSFQLKAFADQVYSVLKHSAVADDKARAETLLKEMNNQADVLGLIAAYGKKQHYWFGLPDGEPQDLPAAISRELSASAIRRVNKLYQERGIKYRW
ncbi:MAG: hypothetical protein MRZ79_04715 [Bacteroidia bacterium]|nr:hypothetical protein [Bacteroidia bacterium]